ncbi:MAG TPA: hypothetical protein VKU41_02855 [Polyangiaceae bacterium]|nr:hypothetical protein [Polyangiaceae bacterium]
MKEALTEREPSGRRARQGRNDRRSWFSRPWRPGGPIVFSALLAAFAVACGSKTPPPTSENTAPGGSHDPSHWPADDHSLCERFYHWKTNAQLEVSETVGPGSLRPNIRRVFKTVGDRDSRHTVALCREIDTNLDGLKDVVRTFNEKGEPLHEEADTNFDGKIDSWINFAQGRIEEEDVDTTFAAGRPNVWKFYVDGRLSRIRRNTHCANGKPDIWEIYYSDRLERVGTDTSCDGHVDRWDRDAQLLAAEEAAQEKAAATADGGTGGGTTPVTVGTSGEILDGGGAARDAGKKKK